ncbi:MAG: PrsW family intramembrane metalloprotease [Spirochaetes bacterium]|nr:PrsW family intramembrane metalloprotease [Spirochaetota bacterium]
MIWGLLAIAIAPGVFITLYFYFLDKYEPEPMKKIVTSFFLGFLAAIIAIILEKLGDSLIMPYVSGIYVPIINAFIIIGISEEFSKYLCTIFGPYRWKSFNEVMDGIVYTVAVALGFATFENIFYVLSGGFSVGIIRAFLSVPAHALFSGIMGYNIGLAKFQRKGSKRNLYLLGGLIVASFLHGLYDYIIFIKIFYGLAIIPLVIVLFFVIKSKVRVAQRDSINRML